MTTQQQTSNTAVISPTLDDVTVEATLVLITDLRKDGHSIAEVAEAAAEHLADTVAFYAPFVDPNYDPTDAELEAQLRYEGWSERNAKVMRVVRGIETGEVA